MPATAIDVGSYTIKAVTASTGSKPSVKKAVELFNESSIVTPENSTQQKQLGELLKKLVNDNKLATSQIRLSLPESATSTQVIEIPVLSDAELATAINWQAEQHIPIPKDDLILEYQVLHRPKKSGQDKMRVLLVGARKQIVNRYIDTFINIGLEPTTLETQIISVIRSIGFSENDEGTLVVHMGASSTILAAIYRGGLNFIINHKSGSQIFTTTISKKLNLNLKQAEEYKRAYGIDPQHFEGKIQQVLLPQLDLMVTEMRKAARFFESKHPQETIKRIVLSGAAVTMPGLTKYLTQTLGMETLISSPFATASGNIPQSNQQAFSVCMGLLMRTD